MLLLLFEGSKNYVDEVPSNGITFVPKFVKIGRNVGIIHRQKRDLINLQFFVLRKEKQRENSALNIYETMREIF
jgi:hypothetical protein